MFEPTYDDLIQDLDIFVKANFDIRVFRTPRQYFEGAYSGNNLPQQSYEKMTGGHIWHRTFVTLVSGSQPLQMNRNSFLQENGEYEKATCMYYLGDWPVQKKFNRSHVIKEDFIMEEIRKIKEQWEFDKTVKPYPDRGIYYQILISDFNDLNKLREYWVKQHNQPPVKMASASASSSSSASVGGGGGGGGGGKLSYVESCYADDEVIPYSDISRRVALAVLEKKQSLAILLARNSGVSEYSDTLEGRILQNDWGMAEQLARQRLGDRVMQILNS